MTLTPTTNLPKPLDEPLSSSIYSERNAKPAPLNVNSLIRRYGELKAVDNLSFAVTSGSIFGFLGPNGARLSDA